MASIVIRNLDDALKALLRKRAATHGRSMEAEAREILDGALRGAEPPGRSLGDLVRTHFGPDGGVDLSPYLPKREEGRKPPDFEG